MLLHRGKRSTTCRVFPPGGGARGYTVILEESGIREQFFIENRHVQQYAETGNEQFVNGYIRSGIQGLDRLVNKKKAGKKR
jgi:hypothetical protein